MFREKQTFLAKAKRSKELNFNKFPIFAVKLNIPENSKRDNRISLISSIFKYPKVIKKISNVDYFTGVPQ
jgi:hypothetical protein